MFSIGSDDILKTQPMIQVDREEDLRWYWWENMYAGVVEGAGAAPEPEGGIPYIGFGGSACKDREGNVKPCLDTEMPANTVSVPS